MAIKYTATPGNGYLMIQADDTTNDPDDILEFIDRIIEECRTHGVSKLLMDNRKLFYGRQAAGTYELAVKCIDRLNDKHPMIVAMVVRPERMEYASVYETIGVTQGFEVKVFEQSCLASVWLVDQTPPDGI